MPNIGDKKTKTIPIKISEICEELGVISATSLSISAMAKVAAKIIARGAKDSGGNPYVFVGIVLTNIAALVATKIASEKLGKNAVITVTLYLKYKDRIVEKQGHKFHIPSWHAYDYKITMKK